ncbi:MAG: hypothetical protein QXE05_09510 [Nitrososphaeria archaeon]
MAFEVGSIILEVFASELLDALKSYIRIFKKYRSKCFRISLRTGEVKYLWFCDYSESEKTFTFKENGRKVIYPLDQILRYEVLDKDELPPFIMKEYSFSNMKYTLKDFPSPFIGPNGSPDYLIVISDGSRDISEYKDWLKSQGRTVYDILSPGLRGDFDYIVSLCTKFGIEIAKRGMNFNLKFVPYARESLTLDDKEKREYNLILIGSGVVNRVTRDVLSFYSDYLPIRFEPPNSDLHIISDVGGSRVTYSRRQIDDQDVGMIALLPSPFCKNKFVLIVAGLKVTGTQAGLLALCDAFDRPIQDSFMEREGKTIRIPIRLVRASYVERINGLEVAKGYQLI